LEYLDKDGGGGGGNLPEECGSLLMVILGHHATGTQEKRRTAGPSLENSKHVARHVS